MSIFIEILATNYILDSWEKNPDKPREDYHGVSWFTEPLPINELPLSDEDVRKYLDFLKKINPSSDKINVIKKVLEERSRGDK